MIETILAETRLKPMEWGKSKNVYKSSFIPTGGCPKETTYF